MLSGNEVMVRQQVLFQAQVKFTEELAVEVEELREQLLIFAEASETLAKRLGIDYPAFLLEVKRELSEAGVISGEAPHDAA